jgi:hypothetical protein
MAGQIGLIIHHKVVLTEYNEYVISDRNHKTVSPNHPVYNEFVVYVSTHHSPEYWHKLDPSGITRMWLKFRIAHPQYDNWKFELVDSKYDYDSERPLADVTTRDIEKSIIAEVTSFDHSNYSLEDLIKIHKTFQDNLALNEFKRDTGDKGFTPISFGFIGEDTDDQ